jgi:hypothetical protein
MRYKLLVVARLGLLGGYHGHGIGRLALVHHTQRRSKGRKKEKGEKERGKYRLHPGFEISSRF